MSFARFRRWSDRAMTEFYRKNFQFNDTFCRQLLELHQSIHGTVIDQGLLSESEDISSSQTIECDSEASPSAVAPSITPLKKTKKKSTPVKKSHSHVEKVTMKQLERILIEDSTTTSSPPLLDPRKEFKEKTLTSAEKKDLILFLVHPQRKKKQRINSCLSFEEVDDLVTFLPIEARGADIERIFKVACETARDRRISIELLKEATLQTFTACGPQIESLTMTAEDEWCTAIHEAGHVLAAMTFKLPQLAVHQNPKRFEYATIIPRKDCLGFVMLPLNVDTFDLITKKKVAEKEIRINFAGFIAEYLFVPESNTHISANNWRQMRIYHGHYGRDIQTDFKSSWNIADAVCRYQYKGDSRYINGQILQSNIEKLLDRCYNDTIRFLQQNEQQIKLLATSLIDKKTITYEDAVEILRDHPINMTKAKQIEVLDSLKVLKI